MNKVALVIVFLLMLAGCAKEQDLTQKSNPVAPVQEAKQIEPVQPIPASTAVEEPGMQVAPPVAVVQEMQAQIKKVEQQKAPVKPAAGAEGIIAENMWGYSVYDPQTGIEELYTSNSTLLGSRKR